MATTSQRLQEYEELYRQAQQYDPNKFQNDFEREYNEKVNYNKDLIDQQSSALGELQTVAPTLREKYMNTLISDPTAQMALIAQARQAPITQWGTASNLLNARGQRYQDILAKALGAYQTSAQQANTAAENAWRLYQDALQQDQFNAQLRASRGGGGGGGLDLASLLSLVSGQGNTQTMVEPKYEIPTGGIAPLGDSYQDRLAQQVLNQQNATGFGNILKSYLNTELEPFRNIKSLNDVVSIPARAIAARTTQVSDLWNRLFKK